VAVAVAATALVALAAAVALHARSMNVEPTGPYRAWRPPPIGQDGCPMPRPDDGFTESRTGPLVPTGATGAVLCRVPDSDTNDDEPTQRLALRAGFDALVTALNALPDRDASRVDLRDRQGWVAIGPVAMACNLVGYSYSYSLVMSYSDRPPVYVVIDQSCGTVVAEGRVRYLNPDVVEVFYSLYRDQLARDLDPAAVAVAACPDTMPDPAAAQPTDGRIAFDYTHVRRWALPAPLAAVTACRYQLADSGVSTLLKQDSRTAAPSGALIALRDAVNAQFRRGNPIPAPRCDAQSPPTRADLLFTVDVTGADWLIWIYRDLCPVAADVTSARYTASSELLAAVDGLLGPP
jgi:hypothetical protein